MLKKGNYSEPLPIHSQNRAFHALSRCFAANFAHIWGGNSIRVTLSNLINYFLHASMTNQFTKFDRLLNSYKKRLITKIPDYTMVTNGVLIDEKMAKIIAKHNIRLTISIDGPSEIHDILRLDKNGNGTFEMCKNIFK